ncbi:MAG: beta-galactosidase [Acidobacteriota bacterium]|nr:beta-galactosidase [Acidobacteriota bacterium]
MKRFGITTVRETARWHLIEPVRGEFDFSSLALILDAAAETGTQVILDLLHFGWPDFVDPLSSSFAEDFANFTYATVTYLHGRKKGLYLIAPVNEISFLSWAGGEAACVNPYREDCAAHLKRNLVRAAVLASEILLGHLPGVRLISPEPVIHIVENPEIPGSAEDAKSYCRSQFEGWDMLSGRLAPELGGRPEYLDIIGTNFYDRNEWVHHGDRLLRDDDRYRPFHQILEEVWTRYRRPIFVSETGTEDGWRADWFNYISDEVVTAINLGVPVGGICLYPILNHPGWEDDRPCQNGLFDHPDEFGNRNVHWPLAHAVRAQQRRFSGSTSVTNDLHNFRPDLSFAPSLEFCLSTSATSDEPLRKNG